MTAVFYILMTTKLPFFANKPRSSSSGMADSKGQHEDWKPSNHGVAPRRLKLALAC